MLLSKSAWHFVVEDLLGVREEECARLLARADHGAAPEEAMRTVARTLLARAAMSGIASGLADSLLKTIPIALIEQRTSMRQRALFNACMRYLDDPRFFDRHDWPLLALGGDGEDDVAIALREFLRFALRLAIVRGAHAVPVPFSRFLAGGVGAAFNAIEMRAIAKRSIDERSERNTTGAPVRELSSALRNG